MALQSWWRRWRGRGRLKFAVILGVAFPLMFASYQLLVRHSFIGAILNGPRESRVKSVAPAPHGAGRKRRAMSSTP